MAEKFLGKIITAEFGKNKDYPFLFGIQLEFQFDGCCICGCGGKYMVNISEDCQWVSRNKRAKTFMKSLDKVKEILDDANCSYVSELVGKPIEIVMDNNLLKDFRILTEVI